MMSYQKLKGNIQFTSDQVDSLTAEEVSQIMRGGRNLILMLQALGRSQENARCGNRKLILAVYYRIV